MGLKDLFETMNYNLARETTGKSCLPEIQKAITELFFKNQELTEEQIKNFEANLYTNPNMFDKNISYAGLETVGMHFNMCLNNHKNLETGKTL